MPRSSRKLRMSPIGILLGPMIFNFGQTRNREVTYISQIGWGDISDTWRKVENISRICFEKNAGHEKHLEISAISQGTTRVIFRTEVHR